MHILISVFFLFSDPVGFEFPQHLDVGVNPVRTDSIGREYSIVSAFLAPQMVNSMAKSSQVNEGRALGMCIGMMWRDKSRLLHPYILAEVATIDSGDEYPINYADGNRSVNTTAELLTNTSSVRLGVSADFPVKGLWIPRIFFEVGRTNLQSFMRIPRPDPGPDESAYYMNRKSLHKDAAFGWGGGIALRREFVSEVYSPAHIFLEFSISMWQTGRIEYLHTDMKLAETIRQNGEEAYTDILADDPFFEADYYQGYRYFTPLDHLTFRFSFGVSF